MYTYIYAYIYIYIYIYCVSDKVWHAHLAFCIASSGEGALSQVGSLADQSAARLASRAQSRHAE